MNELSFDWGWMMPVALVLGAMTAGVVLLAARRKRERLVRLAEPALIARIAPPTAIAPARWRAARLGVASLLAGVALAGPRWGEEPALVRGEGLDVVLALDASLSMLATDERPNRLERLKQEVRRYRALSRSDRVAMLAFAGRSYILTPLTVDDGAIELFLDNLDPSIVGQAGSSLARTLTQATDLLTSSRATSDRAIVVMSDGEAFEPIEEIVAAARRARDARIAVVAVGFGTAEGSTIPVKEGDDVVEKRDGNGDVVRTRYSAETMRAIAEASGGTFIDAAATDKATQIRGALRGLRTASRTVSTGVTRTPRFQLFALAALALLLFESWRADRSARRRSRTALALGGAAVVAGCTWPGSVARDAAREYSAGRHARAAALYRHAISRGDARPEMLYNLGTALVAGDSLEAAAEPLERASRPEDSELRFRSLFNLGLLHLKQGLLAAGPAPRGERSAPGEPGAGGDPSREALRQALATYKRVLIMRPSDMDAKWNYELALRQDQEQQGGGGGGGGGGGESDADRDDSGDADTPQAARPTGGLGEQQAEQLLNAAAREERGVQGRKQRQSRPQPPPGGKDW